MTKISFLSWYTGSTARVSNETHGSRMNERRNERSRSTYGKIARYFNILEKKRLNEIPSIIMHMEITYLITLIYALIVSLIKESIHNKKYQTTNIYDIF